MELKSRESRAARVCMTECPRRELNRDRRSAGFPLGYCRIESAHAVSPGSGKEPARKMRGNSAEHTQDQCLFPPARLENLKSHRALGREIKDFASIARNN